MKFKQHLKKFGAALKSSVKSGIAAGAGTGLVLQQSVANADVDDAVTLAFSNLVIDIAAYGVLIILATVAIAVIKYSQAAIV